MSGLDQSLKLRAQEIIANTEGHITLRQAVKRALVERFDGNFDALAEAAATLGAASLSGIRKRTYELPEEDGQDVLPFDIPEVIGIRTPEGDLLVHRPSAEVGHVRQWVREGHQHHAAQKYRFNKFAKELDLIEDLDDALEWNKGREVLTEKELEERERERIEQAVSA